MSRAKRKKLQRALLFVNPNARKGDASIDPVRAVLEEGGLTLIDAEIGKRQTASHVIKERAHEADLVVVGGGDGSLNGAAEGLAETGLPLGVLPLGTANDFARTIGLPLNPVEAAKVIVAGRIGKVDLGEVNGKPFFNVASVGFSAELAGELSGEAKKRWGVLGYGLVAARLLARSQLFTATLDHDGTTERIRTLQVSVGNGRHYGGGMTVAEDATADDGWLDVYSLEVDNWRRLLRLLPALRKGTHGEWDDVRAFKTKGVTIRTSKRRAVNMDGELAAWTPAKFTIRPKAVKVFVPKA